MTSRFEYQGFLVPLFSFDGKCFQALIYRAIVPIRTSSIRPSSHLSLAAGSFRPFLDDCRSLDVPSGSSSITSVARCEGYRGKSFGTCVIGLCRQIEAREILFDSFFSLLFANKTRTEHGNKRTTAETAITKAAVVSYRFALRGRTSRTQTLILHPSRSDPSRAKKGPWRSWCRPAVSD